MTECDCHERTISQALLTGRKLLQEETAIESPLLDAEVLLSKVMGLSRSELYVHRERKLAAGEHERYLALLTRRKEGAPVAYLTGEKEFMSMKFLVTPDCLIPRPETELLVENVIRWVNKRGISNPRILDIGTGSGCIAVSLASFLPDCKVIATDISSHALRVARKNAALHLAEQRIDFFEGDLFEAIPLSTSSYYDVIVSNPPYIAIEEKGSIPGSVKDFEPSCALWDADGGLAISRRILEGARHRLREGGIVALEINPDYCRKMRSMFAACGFGEIEVCNDLAGMARVIMGRFK